MTNTTIKRKEFVIIVEYADVLTHLLFLDWKNHIGYQNKIRYRFTPQILSNNNQSDVSESEHQKIKLNRTTLNCGRDIMRLADELDLCDDGNVL